MVKRIDYQNPDDNLEEIADKRNAEIRAWGKKTLADADLVAGGYPNNATFNDPPYPEPEPFVPVEVVEPEPELTLSEVIPVVEAVAEEPVAETPKAPKPRVAKGTTTP